jgi:hypothetical protein
MTTLFGEELLPNKKPATESSTESVHDDSLSKKVYQDLRNKSQQINGLFDNKWLSSLFIVGIILFVIYIIQAYLLFKTEAGYIYHYQNLISRQIYIYQEPGVHFKIPWGYSRLTRYDKAWTVNFGISYSGEQIRRKGPIKVTMADTHTAEIPATFRFKLPKNDEKLEMIHREFKTFDELIDSLLIKTARDVVVNTATQYTGEEFFLGGFNQFKAALIDQLRDGIYKTERRQVEVEQIELVPVGLNQEESMQERKKTSFIWKTVPVVDEKGQKIRIENPLDPYGIEITQVTLGEPIAEPQLEKLLADKKHLVGERIKTMQQQETTKEQAKTAQLEAEVERIKARQEALKRKDLAVIAEQLEIEVAQKKAEKEIIDSEKLKRLAVIKKEEELAIAQKEQDIEEAKQKAQLIKAQAELNIQKALFEAAQFEAKAIEEKGLAEAKVLKAKYEARIPEIYLAEIKKEIAQIMYPNLKGITVTMPHNIVNLGDKGDTLPTNLDILSSFAAIGVMDGLEKRANQAQKMDEYK